MEKMLIGLLVGLAAVAVQAEDIMVSWTSNGVLRAEGMEPGAICDVEAVSNLGEIFTNAASFFDSEYVVDSNGMVQVPIPMFFRVSVTPVPEGMVVIPAGTNSGTDPDYGAYSLTVTNAFYMDATEVTKAQWDTVYTWAIANGYSFSNAGLGKGADHPVHTVNWYDCVKWCNARSEKDGKTPCYTVSGSTYKTGESAPGCNFDVNGYRLPTSDEWEYAARGGLSGNRFPWGDTISHALANYAADYDVSYDESYPAGKHPDYDDGGTPYTSPAGSFSANGYGLYDMSGNVWEWCNTSSGSDRNVRGGSWGNNAINARCGVGVAINPGNENITFGFRAVWR